MAQNLINRESNGNSADVADGDKPKGVIYEKRTGKWGARISVDGKTKWLGTFDSVEDAADAVGVAEQSIGDKYTPRKIRSSREVDLSKRIPGVRYLRKRKKWEARIKVFGETIYIGSYRTKLEAAEARWQAEEYFADRVEIARKVKQ